MPAVCAVVSLFVFLLCYPPDSVDWNDQLKNIESDSSNLMRKMYVCFYFLHETACEFPFARHLTGSSSSRVGGRSKWANEGDEGGARYRHGGGPTGFGDALEWASEEMKGDRDIVLAAVRQDSAAVKLASEEMKGDRDIVMAAVQVDGWALEHAAQEMKEDVEIVVATLRQLQPYPSLQGGLFRSLSEEVQRNELVRQVASGHK